MNEILLWVKENLGVLLTGTGLVGFLGFLTHWLVKKVVPRLISGVTNMFAKLISNMFGISYGEGKDMVNALPIVDDLKKIEDKIVIEAEMKLLELKQKLASPIYTAAEKAPIQATFDYLFNKVKSQLSPEVLKILEMFEE